MSQGPGRIAPRWLGAILLVGALPLCAQTRIEPFLSISAERWVSGAFDRAATGLSLLAGMGVRTEADLSVGVGFRQWRHGLGTQTWVHRSAIIRAQQAIGSPSSSWRPFVGGHLGYGFYDEEEFAEPFSGPDLGAEAGIEFGRGPVAQLLLQISRLRFSGEPGGVTVGIGVAITGRPRPKAFVAPTGGE